MQNALKKSFIFALLITSLGLHGCASLGADRFVRNADRPEDAVRFFRLVDQAVQRSGVRDTSAFRIKGFPYLRVNRFASGFREKQLADEQKQVWIEFMRTIDLEARAREIRNLPPDAFQKLQKTTGVHTREEMMNRLSSYSEKLANHDQTRDNHNDFLKNNSGVPDEYSPVMRVFGLYPLFAAVIKAGAQRAYDEFRDWHKTPVDKLQTYGTVKIYTPPPTLQTSEKVFVAKKLNSLHFPELSRQDKQNLAYALAPVIYQDTVDDYDRPGQVVWKDGKVSVDTTTPTVYYYLTQTFIGDDPYWQVNYTFWYTARAGSRAPKIEHGRLDGQTIRLTLDNNGIPVIIDTTNNCGCYYMAFPDKTRFKVIDTKQSGIPLLVPGWLPEGLPDKPLSIRFNTGWHQLQKIFTQETTEDAIGYQILPYDVLENLDLPEGGTASVFNRHGIMKDSNRIEPYLFFPSGIAKVGFMRQRGRHPLKLAGKAHFTDPFLFNSFLIHRDNK